MLSFFRKKSLEDSNQSADQTVPSTSSSRNNSICDNMRLKDSDALVRELGYNNLTELKETIYGKKGNGAAFNLCDFAILILRYVENHQRSRKTINLGRLECCL